MGGICGRIERNVVYLLLEQQQNNKSTCHSERSAKHVVEVFVRERAARGDEPSKNRGANATKGYGLDFGWLSTVNVTFRWQATEILSHIPLRLKASRFCSVIHFAKVRLRKTQAFFSAQNDIQRLDLAIYVMKNNK